MLDVESFEYETRNDWDDLGGEGQCRAYGEYGPDEARAGAREHVEEERYDATQVKHNADERLHERVESEAEQGEREHLERCDAQQKRQADDVLLVVAVTSAYVPRLIEWHQILATLIDKKNKKRKFSI